MPVGGVIVDTLKIGNLDLTDPSIAQYVGVDVFFDIFDPFPKAKIRVNDFRDMLGTLNINGDEEIEIGYKMEEGSGIFQYKFMTFENNHLNDRSRSAEGSMKSKQFDINAVAPEYLKAKAHGNVGKSYNTQV